MITNYETYKEAAKKNGITSEDVRVVFPKLIKVAHFECNDYFNDVVNNYIKAEHDNVDEVLLNIYYHQQHLTTEFKVNHLYKVNQELIRMKSQWRYKINMVSMCVEYVRVGKLCETVSNMGMTPSMAYPYNTKVTHLDYTSTPNILQAIKDKPLSHDLIQNITTYFHLNAPLLEFKSIIQAIFKYQHPTNEFRSKYKDTTINIISTPTHKSSIYEDFTNAIHNIVNKDTKNRIITGDMIISNKKNVRAVTESKQTNKEITMSNEKTNMSYMQLEAEKYFKALNACKPLNKNIPDLDDPHTYDMADPYIYTGNNYDTYMKWAGEFYKAINKESKQTNKEAPMPNQFNINVKDELTKVTVTANVPGLDADDLNFVVDTETNKITIEVIETGEFSTIQLANKFEAENATITVDKGVLTIVATPKKGRMQVLKANVKVKTPTDSKKKTKKVKKAKIIGKKTTEN